MIKNPIYLALDTSNIQESISMIEQVSPFIGGIKIGLEFFTSCGLSGLDKLNKFDLPFFIDLKLHDISTTVKKALSNILAFNPTYTTVHISCGSETLIECVNLKKELNSKTNLIGVTMLTNFDDNLVREIGIEKTVAENVKSLASLAHRCGLDGVVCSPMEIGKIKEAFGSKLKTVIPGIRNNTDKSNDQKRTLSAKEAITLGADILVIGRPITEANNPSEAAKSIFESI